MADIFISYSSRRRELTRDLENRLDAQGYDSVWWDRELVPAAEFGPQIREELDKAKAVVVIWTPEATASAYVRSEARLADSANKLVSVRTPDTPFRSIPEPFGEYHIAELDNLDDILRGIASAWKGTPPRNALLAEHYFRNTGRHVLEAKRETLSLVASVSPALLLNARLALAPYLDVHGIRAGMVKWANEGRPVRGRLIHGPGGLGKTRLMAEVAADLRAQDWAAGFVEVPDADSWKTHRQALEQLIDTDRHAGLMLVFDYAERRQEEAARFAELMLRAGQGRPWRPLRLVLLARADGEWWERAVEESPSLKPVFTGGVVKIAPFADVAKRERLFTEACAGFRQAIAEARRSDAEAFAGWSLEERPTPDRLRQGLASDAFSRPLMIQIAALQHLQGEIPDTASVAALLGAMLGLERRYWRAALGNTHTETRQAALCRATIQTTLVGGAARGEAEALLLKDGYFARAAAADVAEPLSDLERIYGDGVGGLLALEPDLVGEHLAASDGDLRLIDACLDWVGNDTGRSRAILTVLQRATRGEHGLKARGALAALGHVLATRAQALAADLVLVALETPGKLYVLMEQAAPTLDPDAADALNCSIPMQTQLLMKAAGALAVRACAGAVPVDEAGRSIRAGRLNRLGNRLSALGRREDALEASAEAVEIRRELAVQNREAFLPLLAGSLSNLGIRLFDLGRLDEALKASAEAVEICREIMAQKRDDYQPDLALYLSNLGADFSVLNRPEEALEASAEAVKIYRELVARSRDDCLPRLAWSLSNMSLYLSNLDRPHEALKASAEAVEIYRVLAAQNRDAFLPDLAGSLDNLGANLSTLSRPEEALEASAEAVKIYRELVARDRDDCLPRLASSLSILGDILIASGRTDESISAYTECATLLKPFAEKAPGAFGDLFAANLNHLVQAMRVAGISKGKVVETILSFGGDPQALAN